MTRRIRCKNAARDSADICRAHPTHVRYAGAGVPDRFDARGDDVARACDGSNRSFAEIGIPEGHHDLSHHRNNQEWIQKLSDIDLWYAKQFAHFLERLRDTKDVDGKSLLDNSMIVYGSGNADGNAHSTPICPSCWRAAAAGH